MVAGISGVFFYIEHNSDTIEIIDGSIYRVYKLRKSEVLVSKESYESTSRFIDFEVSPDGQKICFLGETIVPIWLYYGDFDKGLIKNIKRIGIASNCVWSNDSQKIAYNNHTTDVSPIDVYVYDLETEEIVNVTKPLQPENKEEVNNIRFYQRPVWSSDDFMITANFTTLDSDGVTTINVLSGEIEDSF